MQAGQNEKVTYKITPCKAPKSCSEYEDYDPCEASDDITERDLAVLLNKEREKIEREREEAERGRLGVKSAHHWGDGYSDAEKKEEVDKSSKERKTADKERREADKDATKADEKSSGEEEQVPRVKRKCKKLIKNPFFSNRLNFSSDLPPPPPSPPPQYLPTVESSSSRDKICKKKRRKCKKVADSSKSRAEGLDKDGLSGKIGAGRGGGTDDEGGAGGLGGLDGEEGKRRGVGSEGDDGDDREGGRGKKGGADDAADGKGKGRCRKGKDRPPCRKKEPEISITLQPRQIPHPQKDLPRTPPGDVVDPRMPVPCKKVCKKRKKKSREK